MSPVKCLPAIDSTMSKYVHAAASRWSSDVDNERPTEVPTAMFFSSAKFIETAAAGFCRICLQVMMQPSRGHTWHLCESCLTSSVHRARLGIVCAQTRGKPVQKRAETRANRIRRAWLAEFRTLHSRRSTGAGENSRQRRREGNDAPPASTFA